MSEPNIRAYHMYQSGSIPGLPNPDAPSGLWPGGVVVYVDMDAMKVISTSLIGGLPAPAPAPEPSTSPELLQKLASTLEEATTLEHELIDQSNQ